MLYNFDELTFQILTVGLFSHKTGFYEVSPRPYAAVSFRLSGTGRFEIDGKQFTSSKGDVLFLPANMGYKVEYSPSESIVVHFSDCNYCEAENVSSGNTRLMEEMFRDLLQKWEEAGSINGAKAAVYTILDRLSDNKKRLENDTAFQSCLQYLEHHAFDADLKMDAVCRAGFMSPSGMQRTFHQHYGMSPKAYLSKLRMSRALSLLAQNLLSVGEIAEACGFRDEKYFSRAFKTAYGYPPSKFRNKTIV